MLERVSTILKMADESNTAVISFICTDYNMAYSVVKTAEKTNTPVLVMLWDFIWITVMIMILLLLLLKRDLIPL